MNISTHFLVSAQEEGGDPGTESSQSDPGQSDPSNGGISFTSEGVFGNGITESNRDMWWSGGNDPEIGSSIAPGSEPIGLTNEGNPSDPSNPSSSDPDNNPATPPPPTDVLAAASSCIAGQSPIKITWTNPAGAQWHKIERTPDGTTWTIVGYTTGPVTEYTDMTPAGNTWYAYRVSAAVSGFTELSSPSNTNWVLSLVCVPPGNFYHHPPVPYCAAVGTSAVHLSWTQSSGAAGYNVYWVDLNNPSVVHGPAEDPYLSVGKVLSYNVPLAPERRYTFLIESYNDAGWNHTNPTDYWSHIVWNGATTSVNCSIPESFTLSASSICSANPYTTSATISKSKNATHYDYYRYDTSGTGGFSPAFNTYQLVPTDTFFPNLQPSAAASPPYPAPGGTPAKSIIENALTSDSYNHWAGAYNVYIAWLFFDANAALNPDPSPNYYIYSNNPNTGPYTQNPAIAISSCTNPTVTNVQAAALACAGVQSPIRITWTNPPGAKWHKIERTTGGRSWITVGYTNGNDPLVAEYTDPTPGNSTWYAYRVSVAVSGFTELSNSSNSNWVRANDCASPGLPTIELYINGSRSDQYPPTKLVKVNEPATLTWTITNATSCSASSNPSQDYWDSSVTVNPVSGSQALTTSTVGGPYGFTLLCSNANGPISKTIFLQVDPLKKPYFKTTGGDVHTNKEIFISP